MSLWTAVYVVYLLLTNLCMHHKYSCRLFSIRSPYDLASAAEPPMCGGDAASCEKWNYFDHLLWQPIVMGRPLYFTPVVSIFFLSYGRPYIFVLWFILSSSIGSRPSDHYFRSVCWFVCLFEQSFSQPSLIRFRSNLDICYMFVPKNLVFVGVLGLKKLSRPTVLIGLSWFLVIL